MSELPSSYYSKKRKTSERQIADPSDGDSSITRHNDVLYSKKRGHRGPTVAVATTTAAALALAGCTSSENQDSTAKYNWPVVRPTLPPELQYVEGKKVMKSIGDSYSSGEGAPTTVKDEGGNDRHLFIEGTSDPDNHCHRSLEAYPVKLWEKLGKDEWSLDFAACSGAVTKNIYDKAQYKDPSTLQSSVFNEDEQADLITMTMGGNDAGFADILKKCIVGGYINDKIGGERSNCGVKKAEKQFGKDLTALKESLPTLYAKIQENLTDTGRMMVAGYPKFFPDKLDGSCQTGASSKFTKKDMEWINSAAIRANDVIEQAAAEAGISYVNVENLLSFDGKRHDACVDSGSDRWVNRIIPNHAEWSFHPKAAAHAAEAELFKQCYDDPSSCKPEVPKNPDILVGLELPLINDCPAKDDPTVNQEVQVNDIQYADVTGDGIKEALAIVECTASTSSWPEEIRIFDGAINADTPTLIGILLKDQIVKNAALSVDADQTISVTGDTYSSDAGNAEPDMTYNGTFRWNGSQFTGESTSIPNY